MQLRYAIVFAAIQMASADQYGFDPKTYDSSQLFALLSGYYEQYAATWENDLANAKASYPSAYSELTSIFGTDSIPATFDAGFASHLVSEMLEMGPTTIIATGAASETPGESSPGESSQSATSSENTSSETSSNLGSSASESNVFTLTSEDIKSSGAVPCTRLNAFVTVGLAMAGVGLFSLF